MSDIPLEDLHQIEAALRAAGAYGVANETSAGVS